MNDKQALEAYRQQLQAYDEWFAGRKAELGVIPCREGCTDCCRGIFDISLADVALIQEGLRTLAPALREEVEARARDQLDRLHGAEPLFRHPWDLTEIGEDRLDALGDAFAQEPCPLLGSEGACLLYEHRPLVCRLIGIPLRYTDRDDEIPNFCPIQAQFPGYPDLAPEPYDLDTLDAVEALAAEAIAAATACSKGFETTVAGAIAR